MKVEVLKDFAIDREYKAGDIIDISEEDFQFLLSAGLVEPVKQKEPSEQVRIKLPIYIKEFTYNNKTLRDVLIISEEQLQVCLQDRYYGDVFKEAMKQFSCKSVKPQQKKEYAIDRKPFEYIPESIQGESLNRKCINCGVDSWIKAKPTGKTLITCTACGHSELHVPK